MLICLITLNAITANGLKPRACPHTSHTSRLSKSARIFARARFGSLPRCRPPADPTPTPRSHLLTLRPLPLSSSPRSPPPTFSTWRRQPRLHRIRPFNPNVFHDFWSSNPHSPPTPWSSSTTITLPLALPLALSQALTIPVKARDSFSTTFAQAI